MAISRVGRSFSSSTAVRAVVLLPLVVVVDVLVVVALGLLPLGSIGGLRCDAVLRGGDAKPDRFLAPMIAASRDKLCADASHGRVVVMIFVGLLLLVLGAGAVLAPADRLERFLVRHEQDDAVRDEFRWEDAARAAEARDAQIREERALADARRAAWAQAAEEGGRTPADRRAARVARARAARLEARAKAAAEDGAPKVRKATKAAKAAKTGRAATAGVATTKRAATSKKAAGTTKKATSKKAVTAKKVVTSKAVTAKKATKRATVSTRTKAAKDIGGAPDELVGAPEESPGEFARAPEAASGGPEESAGVPQETIDGPGERLWDMPGGLPPMTDGALGTAEVGAPEVAEAPDTWETTEEVAAFDEPGAEPTVPVEPVARASRPAKSASTVRVRRSGTGRRVTVAPPPEDASAR